MNIIISGGHFLGVVVHCAALAEVHRQLRDRGQSIQNVGGLSAGSLVAAAYASGRSIGPAGLERLVSEWMIQGGKHRGPNAIAVPDYVGFAADVMSPDDSWPALYKTDRIRKAIHATCSPTLGDMPSARFRCVLANLTNRDAIGAVKTVVDSHDHCNMPTSKAVLASMAIPLGFPLVSHGDEVFGDGGLAVGNVPFDLWSDIDPTGEETIILRMARTPARKVPSHRPLGLAEDAIDTMLAALEEQARKSMPPKSLVIDVPARGPAAAFDMSPAEAMRQMGTAANAVKRAMYQP